MNVAILGSGEVGQTLGAGFAALGHDVKLGTRKPDDPKITRWIAKAGARVSAGAFADAAAFGEIVVLATSWAGAESALKLAGPTNLAAKIVIDVTNPLTFRPGAPPGLALGCSDSGGEQVQRWLHKSHVVKAFNTIGHAHMVKPQFPGGPPDMFICREDAGAKLTVTDLCKAFGWLVSDIGGIEGARVLEPLALLWVLYGVRTGSWNHAWKLLKK
jgi:8-hydroxy-5-deazaflavin:NADPH oxidoreductase